TRPEPLSSSLPTRTEVQRKPVSDPAPAPTAETAPTEQRVQRSSVTGAAPASRPEPATPHPTAESTVQRATVSQQPESQQPESSVSAARAPGAVARAEPPPSADVGDVIQRMPAGPVAPLPLAEAPAPPAMSSV